MPSWHYSLAVCMAHALLCQQTWGPDPVRDWCGNHQEGVGLTRPEPGAKKRLLGSHLSQGRGGGDGGADAVKEMPGPHVLASEEWASSNREGTGPCHPK